MTCAIVQPSYIPWRGYFHMVWKSDVVVHYDDVQYTRHAWRNRNRVKTPGGVRWLTIPVHAHGHQTEGLLVRDIRIDWHEDWARKHWKTLCLSYVRAPHFARYAPELEAFYASRPERLADFTIALIEWVSRQLGIERTRFLRSSELRAEGDRTERPLAILRQVGADRFVNGPTARDYFDELRAAEAGITVEWMRYDYREYEQLWPPYDPAVSALDLLFMKGPDAGAYIWGSSA